MNSHDRVVESLGQLGGTAPSGRLREVTSRRAVQAAVVDGAVRRPRRGVVSLPVLDETDAAVLALHGARSHLSAALHHGWEVAVPPSRPMITVPRGRHVGPSEREIVRIFWGPLGEDELGAGVTAPVHTVVECARALPFGEALSVADSALRSGRVTRAQLHDAAATSPRTGRPAATRVAEAADRRAANPFESMLRAIALEVPGLSVEPQVHIGGDEFVGAPDLVDRRLGIVIEAESWSYHGDRAAFDNDVRRYTALVRAGWHVVRFLWADVRDDPDEVRAVLVDLVRGGR